jgi:flagellar P-ring protein precursor FlgI
MRLFGLGILTLLAFIGESARAERIKELATWSGVRINQLVGYGLVTGLDQTGDQTTQTPFTVQTLRNMLLKQGISIPPGQFVRLRNVAAVAVHADMPPFARPGQAIDVTVSSMGNASSLRGGSLLMTPLYGADGQIYAIAQGNVVVPGVGVQGMAARLSVNTPTAGRIPSGATVEKAIGSPFAAAKELVLDLKEPDFTTAQRISEAINRNLGKGTARALDSGAVAIAAPQNSGYRVNFISMLENLQVTPAVEEPRVVVNSRTGTVVIGGSVRIQPAAVSHGNLAVRIAEGAQVTQPQPFGGGQTAVVPQTQIQMQQERPEMFMVQAGASLDELVQAVNRVGATPDDLIAILEALKEVGALKADLVVI